MVATGRDISADNPATIGGAYDLASGRGGHREVDRIAGVAHRVWNREVAEPKYLALPKLHDWPIFQAPVGTRC